MFRVYDNERKEWLKDNVYLGVNGELFKIKQSLFGMVKVPLVLSGDRYIYHRDINLQDKNGQEIFEGDYIQAKIDEDKEEIGLVAYAHELSAYVILCVNSDTFYTLGSNVSSEIQVIGNVFDGYEEVKENGESTLSQSEK